MLSEVKGESQSPSVPKELAYHQMFPFLSLGVESTEKEKREIGKLYQGRGL